MLLHCDGHLGENDVNPVAAFVQGPNTQIVQDEAGLPL